MDELLSLLDKFSERNPGPWRSAARQVWTALGRAVDRSVAADSLPDNELLIRVWRLIADQKFKRGLDAYYCTYRDIEIDTGRIQNNLLLLLASAATAGECNRALSQNGSASTSNWNTATYTVPDFLRAEYDNRFDIKARPTLRHWTMHWLGEIPPPDHSVTVPAVAVTNQGCLCDFVFDKFEAPDAGLVEGPTMALRPFSKALLSLLNVQYAKRAPGIQAVWKFEFRPDQRAGPETPVDGDSFGAGIAAGLELLASDRRFAARSILTASLTPSDGLTKVSLVGQKLAAIPRSDHRVGLAHNQPKGEVGSFEQTLEIHWLATVQDAIAFALGSPVPGMGREAEKLWGYLVGKNPRARAEAADALAKAGYVERLNKALCHRSEEVRIAAAVAVCRFKVGPALPCLVSGIRKNGKRKPSALIPGVETWIREFRQLAIGPLVDEILRTDMKLEERQGFATALAGCIDVGSAFLLLSDERLFRREPEGMSVLEGVLRSGVELSRSNIEPRLAKVGRYGSGFEAWFPAKTSEWILESSIRQEQWAHALVKEWLFTAYKSPHYNDPTAERTLPRTALEMGAVDAFDLTALASEMDLIDLPFHKRDLARRLRQFVAGEETIALQHGTHSTGPTPVQEEWTNDGPKLLGNDVSISALEWTALFDRYLKTYDSLREKGDIHQKAMVSAVIKAFEETYQATIFEEDLRDLNTEIGKKADLFFRHISTLSNQKDIVEDKTVGVEPAPLESGIALDTLRVGHIEVQAHFNGGVPGISVSSDHLSSAADHLNAKLISSVVRTDVCGGLVRMLSAVFLFPANRIPGVGLGDFELSNDPCYFSEDCRCVRTRFGLDVNPSALERRDPHVHWFVVEVHQSCLRIHLSWGNSVPVHEFKIIFDDLAAGSLEIARALGARLPTHWGKPWWDMDVDGNYFIFMPLLRHGIAYAKGDEPSVTQVRSLNVSPPTTDRGAAAGGAGSWQFFLKPQAAQWTARCIRLGLKCLALDKSVSGISLSVAFTSALHAIVTEISIDDLREVFDKLPLLCLRAILRAHPGGEAAQEDIVYLSNQLFEPVLAASLDIAASYGLLTGSPDAGFALSEDFKEEFVDAFLREEDTRGNRRSACAKALLQVSEAAALAKGDGDPTNAKMAMLGLSIYMKGTGMLASYGASEVQGSDQGAHTDVAANVQEPPPRMVTTGLSDRLRDAHVEVVCAAVQEIIESRNGDVPVKVLDALQELIRTYDNDGPLLAAHAFVHLGRGPLKNTVCDILAGLTRSGLRYTEAAAWYALRQIEGEK